MIAPTRPDPGRPRLARLASSLLVLIFLTASLGPAQVTPSAADDATAEERLAAIFSEIPGLSEVEVSVSNGVAHLSGSALSTDERQRAVALAESMEGVVAVDDRIEEVRAVSRRLEPVVGKLEALGADALSFLPLVLVALVVFLVFWQLGRWIGRWERPFRRIAPSPFARELAQRTVQASIVVGGLLLALELLDATALVGAVLGTAGVVGLAIGFAFRDLVENSIASVLLSLRQPFGPGDHVLVDGHEGKVIRLTSRATILRTVDGNHLRIPNAQVFKAVILNYDRNPRRRFELRLGIHPDEDLAAVVARGSAVLGEMDGVLGEPPPLGLVVESGDWAVTVAFFAWMDQDRFDFNKVRSEAIRLVLDDLSAAGIDMPEPSYRVRTGPLEPGEARPRAKTPAAAETGDLSPEEHLDEEIEAERRTLARRDLLDESAPKE